MEPAIDIMPRSFRTRRAGRGVAWVAGLGVMGLTLVAAQASAERAQTAAGPAAVAAVADDVVFAARLGPGGEVLEQVSLTCALDQGCFLAFGRAAEDWGRPLMLTVRLDADDRVWLSALTENATGDGILKAVDMVDTVNRYAENGRLEGRLALETLWQPVPESMAEDSEPRFGLPAFLANRRPKAGLGPFLVAIRRGARH